MSESEPTTAQRLSWLWRELFFLAGRLPKQPKRLMVWLDYLRDGDLYP